MFCKITLRFSLFVLFLTISSFSITETTAFKSIEKSDKADFTVEETKKDISISNGIIELKFYKEESGFGLNSIRNVQKDHDFMLEQPDKSIIWEIEFKHTSNRLVLSCDASQN